MTVRDFGRVLWAGRWYVLAAVLVVVAATLWFADRQVTEYEAAAAVQLEESATGSGSVVVGDDPSLLTSPDIVSAAEEALGDPIAEGESVEASYDSETLTFVVQSRALSQERATALANTYAQAYLEYLPTLINDQVTLLDEQISAVSEQVSEARETLEGDKDDPVATALEQTGNETLAGLTSTLTAYLALVRPGQVSIAAVGATPVGLDTAMILAIAVLAGIVAGVGAAFLRFALDMRVRTAHEVAEISAAPVLAGLANARRAMKWAQGEKKLPVATRVATPFTESIRELRTAIQVGLGESRHGTIVVSAAEPRAPRAFVAANLAASFALSGRHTIVLSGDLRRPQIDELLPPPDGWSGTRGQLRASTVPNLEVCPMPDVPLDPADYLASASARDLFDALKRRADIVVVDAPPVLAAADATILGSYADGVVLVAEIGKTDRAVLAEAASRLSTNSVRLLGVAVAGRSETHRAAYAATYGEVDEATTSSRHSGESAEGISFPSASSTSSTSSASSASDAAGIDRGGKPSGAPAVPWARIPFMSRDGERKESPSSADSGDDEASPLPGSKHARSAR